MTSLCTTPEAGTATGREVLRVVKATLLRWEVPFRVEVSHNLASRAVSDNLLLCLELEDGSEGWGECLARTYLTGHSPDAVYAAVREHLGALLTGADASSAEGVAKTVARAERVLPIPAVALLELALLDACGRSRRCSLAELLAPEVVPSVEYSVVVPFLPAAAVDGFCSRLAEARIGRLKIKVGRGPLDRQVFARCRDALGPEAQIGVDANGAWPTSDAALAALDDLLPLGPAFVEQPLPRGADVELERFTRASPTAVVLDESLCSQDDVDAALERGLGHRWNVRISKVGGACRALGLCALARERGLGVHVGGLVGETGILAAAGRWLALAVAPEFTEGSYGSLLLEEDVTAPSVRFAAGGVGGPLGGVGLGVVVDRAAVDRHAVATEVLVPEAVR